MVRARKRIATAIATVGVVVAAAVTLVMPAIAGAASSKKPVVIGSMIFDTSVPFYANMIRGEKAAAKKDGASLRLVNGNNSISTEASAVQQFITQKVSAILVTPSTPTGLVPVLKLASKAHIPVLAVNNVVAKGGNVVTYIGVSDYTYGQQQGRLLVKALNGRGTVGYILGQVGTSAELNRKAGFMSVLKHYPKIKIVASQTANWSNTQALSVTQDWLTKFKKGSLNAIVDQGPEGSTAARFTATTGRSEIKFIVGDYPSSVRTGILKHQIYGTVDQNPYPQGFLGVEYAVDIATGHRARVPKPQAHLPLPLITAKNAKKTAPAWIG